MHLSNKQTQGNNMVIITDSSQDQTIAHVLMKTLHDENKCRPYFV